MRTSIYYDALNNKLVLKTRSTYWTVFNEGVDAGKIYFWKNKYFCSVDLMLIGYL